VSAIDPQFAYDFTDRYAPYLNPLPEVNSFREFARFVPNAQRAGRQFRGPIQSAISHGQTIDITGTAYALNAARPAGEQEYILDAPDILLRETFPYSAMLKASNGVSKEGQAAAYWAPLDKVMMTMLRGIDHYTEIAMLFGPGSGSTILSDIGQLASSGFLVSGGPNYGSSPLVKLTAQSWAPGLWNNAGNGGNSSGGMLVDILNSAGTAIVASGVNVVGVGDPALCQVQFGTSGTAVAVAASQRIVPAGWYQKSCAGVQGWLQNTGTLANINAANNVFWRARQFDASGAALTRAKILQLCAKLFANGAKNGLVGFVNAHTFADLAEETTAPGSGNTTGGQWFENGAETRVQGATKLEYLSPVGKVEIRLHEYQKQGVAFFLEPGQTVRIGAADTTVRGAQGGEGFFLELPNNAGSEVRCTSQQAPFIRYPYRSAIVTNIVSAGQDA
jgi:hypothetical protein